MTYLDVCYLDHQVKKGGIFCIFSFYVRYSTLLHLPLLRFHGVGGCRDRTQELFTIVRKSLRAYCKGSVDCLILRRLEYAILLNQM